MKSCAACLLSLIAQESRLSAWAESMLVVPKSDVAVVNSEQSCSIGCCSMICSGPNRCHGFVDRCKPTTEHSQDHSLKNLLLALFPC
jgi:hypothetical protein